ncbi:hypothetical protein EB001_00865 [bacterium]|nr:hypothetical protein [bacterium]
MSDTESVVDKRLFYLMLSIGQGQEFANFMGFSNPSNDVEQAEIYDVASRWALFVNQGVLESIEESANWVLDFLDKSNKLSNPKEEVLPLFVAYGVSLLNKMLESGNLSIIIDEDALLNWQEVEEDE